MVAPHDWVNYPELTDNQMQTLYYESPHKQIVEDIRVKVIEVHDGDTIKVKWSQRNFLFPIRLADTAAPELKEPGGKRSKEWLKKQIEGKEVDIKIDKNNRVGKYGRLIGRVFFGGIDVNEEIIRAGHATPFNQRAEVKMPDFGKELDRYKIK